MCGTVSDEGSALLLAEETSSKAIFSGATRVVGAAGLCKDGKCFQVPWTTFYMNINHNNLSGILILVELPLDHLASRTRTGCSLGCCQLLWQIGEGGVLVAQGMP